MDSDSARGVLLGLTCGDALGRPVEFESASARTFDPADVADRFVGWDETDPFDIGGMARRSLRKLARGVAWDEAGRQVWANSAEGANAGTGARCGARRWPWRTRPTPSDSRR